MATSPNAPVDADLVEAVYNQNSAWQQALLDRCPTEPQKAVALFSFLVATGALAQKLRDQIARQPEGEEILKMADFYIREVVEASDG